MAEFIVLRRAAVDWGTSGGLWHGMASADLLVRGGRIPDANTATRFRPARSSHPQRDVTKRTAGFDPNARLPRKVVNVLRRATPSARRDARVVGDILHTGCARLAMITLLSRWLELRAYASSAVAVQRAARRRGIEVLGFAVI